MNLSETPSSFTDVWSTNTSECPPGWSYRSHFFAPGVLDNDGSPLSCYTHENTFIGLSYLSYIVGILSLILCLWRILNSRPIILFSLPSKHESQAHSRRRDMQGVLFNTTLEMLCTVAIQTGFLFFDQLLYKSMCMTVFMVIYYVATTLDSIIYLRLTVSTALLGVRAMDSNRDQQRNTTIVNAASMVILIIIFGVFATGIIGLRLSSRSDPSSQLAFSRVYFAASASASVIVASFAYLHVSIIISALKKHSKTAKSHGLDGKHFKEVIERLSKERLAAVVLIPFTFYAIVTIFIPRIMTYALPVTNIWVCLLGLAGSSTPPLDYAPGPSALSDTFSDGSLSSTIRSDEQTRSTASFQFEAQEEEYLSRSLELSTSRMEGSDAEL